MFEKITLIFVFSTLLSGVCAAEQTRSSVAVFPLSSRSIDKNILDTVYDDLFKQLREDENLKLLPKEGILREKIDLRDICTLKLKEAAAVLELDEIVLCNITRILGKFVIKIEVFDDESAKMIYTGYFNAASEKELHLSIKTAAQEIAGKLAVRRSGEPEKNGSFIRNSGLAKDAVHQKEYNTPDKFRFVLGGYGAFNLLLNGYTNYTGRLCGGVKAGFQTIRDKKPKNSILGLSFDVFPLVTPEGSYGTAEDIWDLNIFYDHSFLPESSLRPYAGLGAGVYVDRIRTGDPQTGNLSVSYLYLGANLHGGLEFPLFRELNGFLEIKNHFILESGGKSGPFIALNLSYGGGAIWYF